MPESRTRTLCKTLGEGVDVRVQIGMADGFDAIIFEVLETAVEVGAD
jgi:hypothetical protein